MRVHNFILVFILFYSAFDQYIYLKTDTKIYTLSHYNIIFNIDPAALEQAYRSLCKLATMFIFIYVQKVLYY